MSALEWVEMPFKCVECHRKIEGFHLVDLDLYEVKPHGGCSGDGRHYDGEAVRSIVEEYEAWRNEVPAFPWIGP